MIAEMSMGSSSSSNVLVRRHRHEIAHVMKVVGDEDVEDGSLGIAHRHRTHPVTDPGTAPPHEHPWFPAKTSSSAITITSRFCEKHLSFLRTPTHNLD